MFQNRNRHSVLLCNQLLVNLSLANLYRAHNIKALAHRSVEPEGDRDVGCNSDEFYSDIEREPRGVAEREIPFMFNEIVRA